MQTQDMSWRVENNDGYEFFMSDTKCTDLKSAINGLVVKINEIYSSDGNRPEIIIYIEIRPESGWLVAGIGSIDERKSGKMNGCCINCPEMQGQWYDETEKHGLDQTSEINLMISKAVCVEIVSAIRSTEKLNGVNVYVYGPSENQIVFNGLL